MVPKFRVWDETQHKMLQVDCIEFIDGKAYWVEASPADGNMQDGNDGPIGDNSQLKLEQYTGLKDVNGKEIYEGDVVRVSFDDESYVDEVVWWGKGGQDSCYPAFDLKKHSADYDQNAFSGIIAYGAETIEVIGNVHTDGDLIDS